MPAHTATILQTPEVTSCQPHITQPRQDFHDIYPCARAGLPDNMDMMPGISITSYAAFAMACTALDCCLLREVHPPGALRLDTGVGRSLRERDVMGLMADECIRRG